MPLRDPSPLALLTPVPAWSIILPTIVLVTFFAGLCAAWWLDDVR